LNLLIKILVEKSKNQSASNSNFESTFARAKLLTRGLAWSRRSLLMALMGLLMGVINS
jgi:hypothetical protein